MYLCILFALLKINKGIKDDKVKSTLLFSSKEWTIANYVPTNHNYLFLQVHPQGQMVYKGSNPDVDSYSAFFDNMKLSKTCLDDIIRKDDISYFLYWSSQEGGCHWCLHMRDRHWRLCWWGSTLYCFCQTACTTHPFAPPPLPPYRFSEKSVLAP